MINSKPTCKPGTVEGVVDPKLPKDKHVWWKFWWPEGKTDARQCRRCLRLEWKLDNKYSEVPLSVDGS